MSVVPSFNLPRIALLAFMGFSAPAHAELREGQACNLAAAFPVDGRTPTPWRDPPANCERFRFIHVSKEVGPAPGIVTVPDPTCGTQLNTPSVAAMAVGAFAGAQTGNAAIGYLVTDLGDQLGKDLGPKLDRQGLPRAVTDLFFQKTQNGSCTSLVAVVPTDAQVRGYRIVVDSLRAGPSQCSVGTECPSGWAKFLNTPVPTKSNGLQYVHVDFMQWSHNTSQTGRLIIFYEMPAGAKPPLPVM